MRALPCLLIPMLFACDRASPAADATNSDGADGLAAGDGVDDGVTGPPKLSDSTLSGYVFDGRSGRALGGVTIETDPPLETVASNGQGAYVISAGQAFGRVTVRASRQGYVQRDVVCVTLKPGRNAIGDVTLAKTAGDPLATCLPACSDTTTCVDGVCVTRCNPPCGCRERCSSAGACEPDPNAPPAGVCGDHAVAIGSGVCECEIGTAPTGDGRSCAAPVALDTCPKGSDFVTNSSGASCRCRSGLVPNVTGDECLVPAEAARVSPFESADVLGTLPAPPGAPRGLAWDGTVLWVGDALSRDVSEISPSSGEVGQKLALGDQGVRLIDVASGPFGLWVALSPDLANPWGNDAALLLVNPENGSVTDLHANDFDPNPGLAFDGNQLVSLEGNRLVRRSPELGQLVAFSQIELTATPELSVAGSDATGAHLAVTGNRAIVWLGSRFDGARWFGELAVLNAAHPTEAAQVDSLTLDLGGSHVRGMDASGNRAWLLVDGTGVAGGPTLPLIVEVAIE